MNSEWLFMLPSNPNKTFSNCILGREVDNLCKETAENIFELPKFLVLEQWFSLAVEKETLVQGWLGVGFFIICSCTTHSWDNGEQTLHATSSQASTLPTSPPKQGILSIVNELNLLIKMKLNKEKRYETVFGFVFLVLCLFFFFFKHTLAGMLKDLLHTFGYRWEQLNTL